MDEFITACPRNCYSTCTFRVQVAGNRIKRILPFEGNLATPEGPCIKGLSYIERSSSPDRIIYPLLRKTDGKFNRIPVKEALDIISSKLSYFSDRYGSHSILWYKGSGMSGLTNDIGYSFWKAFGGTTITYGNLCWPAGLEAVRLTLGSVKHNVPWDLENAKTIIIWGKNTAETNIHEIRFIKAAREKGAKVILIDPVRTLTAEKADILYSVKPGTDAALALAIAWVLINNGMTDNEFINKYVLGYEAFRDSLKITPQSASEITGIPADDIITLAYIIGKGGPVTFLPGYGLQRHLNGGQTIRAILSLAILTGNIGKSGSGFNYANLQSYVFDDVKEPDSYYPDPLKDYPFRRSVSMARLGYDMMQTVDPELKAAFIERGNPLLQSPDSKSVSKAFAELEFKVVVDQFMTDTASIADIILPAKNMFEQSDIIGSYWSPYVQFKPKVTESPGEVLPESEIYYELSKRLGLNIPENLLPEPGNQNIEKWLELRIKGYTELHLNDLRNGPVLAPGLQQIAYSDFKFETGSGKIELFSSLATEKWKVSALPDYTPIIETEFIDPLPLHLITPNTGSRIHSQFGNLKVIIENSEFPGLFISPDDAEKRKIVTGSRVKVYNAAGEISTVAKIENRIPPGSVLFYNGIWLSEGGGGNILITGRETDMGHGAAFHDNMVDVKLSD
ncbi:MAG: molybdopterin-dependent oxidoreductase [Bacteroidetes bacterium]|nr:molybdopterin-dependent oxidoreductase [Bacteroidota bacterium]